VVTPQQAGEVLAEVDKALASISGAEEAAAECMRILAERLKSYKWVGVYWLRGDELILGPYAGEPPAHVRIPVGKGVCGAAVAQGRNRIVPDVSLEPGYLPCSEHTRSEIVVLIRDDDGGILGQIDVDGHEKNVFDHTDERLLTRVAARLSAFAGQGAHARGNPSAEHLRGYRLDMNERILAEGHRGINRFFALDTDAYRAGALPAGTKELMGLVGSTVLRCNDCIFYHLDRSVAEGATRAQIVEALHIALVIGGSIVIPHLRFAFEKLDELLPGEAKK